MISLTSTWARTVAQPNSLIRYCAKALPLAIYIQIILGGFVAGLKAGHISDTWPLMNGALVPPGLGALSPWYMNLLKIPSRLSSPIAWWLTLSRFWPLLARPLSGGATGALRAKSMFAICLCVLAQIALGVATIVYAVPLDLALAHQANAIILWRLPFGIFITLSRPRAIQPLKPDPNPR